jgi:hypothetical protein
MPLTNYARDRFIAPKLSALTTCGAKPLRLDVSGTDAWLPDFVLNTAFRFTVAEPQRQLMFTLLRRVDGALSEYEAGRQALVTYFERRVHSGIQLYSRALLHFEVCVALTYQAWCLIRQLLPSQPRLFDKNDGSEFDRLNRLYNVWRHADERIASGQHAPESTLPLWFVNEGLESRDGQITFDELAEMLVSLHRIAGHVSEIQPAEDTSS